jgi:hypothetical protein
VNGDATPEERSKATVGVALDYLQLNEDALALSVVCQDEGDYLVLFVRVLRPSGRTFVMRITCDDYPRRPPLLAFVDPEGWTDPARRNVVEASYFPTGEHIHSDRGLLPVICMAGQREYYRDEWHTGWTNPPTGDHRLEQMVTNMAIAIRTRWT